MKYLWLILLFLLVVMPSPGQNLLDIYKKGAVKLIPDPDYAKNNDWNKVFETYLDTLYGKPMGNRKSLKIMPDGSVIVNHAYRNFYSKFAPNGAFEKEFGIKNSKGGVLKEIESIEGIINNKIFFTGLDNMGNMICFDFNGNYKKTLKLDYMTRQMIPLPGSKIAVVGWVIWEKKFRDFVAIVDYETNAQKIIWEQFTERSDDLNNRKLFNYAYQFKSGGIISQNTMPFSKTTCMSSPPNLACIGDRLIVAIPTTGEILIYDLQGKLISKDLIKWKNNYISVEEQKVIQQNAILQFRNNSFEYFNNPEESKSAKAYMLKEMEADLDKISDPIPIPFFATVIQDSDGNLLFFEYPKEQNANKFNVWIYNDGGMFVCQSSFICDEYALEINPSKMVFYNGYIYGLQLAKKSSGVPLRLVRFRLVN